MTKEKPKDTITAEEAVVKTFFTKPFRLEGKGGAQTLRITPQLFKSAPVARIVGVSGKHHDVSNSFRVELIDISKGSIYEGTLGDLYADATTMQLDGFDFELTVRNPFEHELPCPRLRFDIVCLQEI